MANREKFPYAEDWREDVPVLIELGIVQAISKHLTENQPSTTGAVREGLHCRVVWSQRNWYKDGQPFLNIEYIYPSLIFGENEVGSHGVDDELLQIDDPEVIERLIELADKRTVNIHNTNPTEYKEAVPK